jgi:adenylate cyclase
MRRVFIGVVLGAAAGGLALLLSHLPVLRTLEDATYDWRLRATARQADARPDIALIVINESSLRAMDPIFGRWPWPRIVHSGVVDFLARAKARVIAYDVLLTDRDRTSFEIGGNAMTGADSDAALAASVARAGNVVMLADVLVDGLRLPYEGLAQSAAAVGHNRGVKATEGVARSFEPYVDVDGKKIPSLGMAAALIADRNAGDAPLPLGQSRELLLNFHGPFEVEQRYTYPTYPFFNVLLSEEQIQGGEKPAIDPAVFKDKLVFIGTSASGLSDIWRDPFGGVGMPGVQLHAALADDVLSRRFMRRASTQAEVATTMAAGVVTGVAATLLPVVWAVPLVLALTAGLGVWLTQQISVGVWLAAVPPIAAMALALFEGVAWQYFVEGREKRRVKGLFGRYVSKDVFNHLMADPSVARLGGGRREMTVLFSDIRGFTSASEKSTPEAVVHQLNEYFTAMVEVLFRHQGTLDKFVGDMVMGLFGAPVADPRHADHAVAAAVEMTEVLDRLNARWTAEGRPPLDIGIGINSGEMIAGNIGSDTIMSYTVIGDAVNLGARLESLNKDYGTRILISGETRAQLTTTVETRLIGDVTVKGKSKSVTVYEVLRTRP